MRASSETGVEIASLFIAQPWASTDSGEREAGVRGLRVAIDTAEELGCARINTEFHRNTG